MKQITQFLYEVLAKPKIDKPKDKKELRKLIEKALAANPDANLNNIDVSYITDMSYLFDGLDPHQIRIEDWDVSNVTDMDYMFADCSALHCDISNWDVSNVQDMSFMFAGSAFNGDISKWNVRNVKKMRSMFDHSLAEQKNNLPKWYKK
jgi:surface protein